MTPMTEIELLVRGRKGCAEKWLAVQDDKDMRTLRRFVGSRNECKAVKAEWQAGNFTRGKMDSYRVAA